ncbi:hypothetical protein ACWEOW_09710 [Monashia sp. NPDC004114]
MPALVVAALAATTSGTTPTVHQTPGTTHPSTGVEPLIHWIGEFEDNQAFGMGIPVPTLSSTASIGALLLCSTGVGAAPTITNVQFATGSDLVRVKAWGLRDLAPGDTMLGTLISQPVASAGFDQRDARVKPPRATNGTSRTELRITMQPVHAPTVTAKDLTITYRSGTSTRTASIPLTIVMCVNQPGTCGP